MIEVSHLVKTFKLYRQPEDRLKEILLRRPFHSRHHALRDISFEVADSETLGIIGKNGAGKSTLLKILSGVLLPDSGTVRSNGRITGLLELGTGFDMTMSGVENILTNGLLLGMTEAEITAQRPAIIDFAELGSFIDEPLRTYSSGMVMRLAFAIAIHASPEIFLIDEALSVGDGHFQQKCMRRIRDFRAQGGSIIFVSHDLNAIKMISDRVIVLNEGEILAQGEPVAAVNQYYQLLAGDGEPATGSTPMLGGYGNLKAEIAQATAKGEKSHCEILFSGDNMVLEVTIVGRQDLSDLTLGLMIRDRFGQDIFGTNTFFMGHPLSIVQGQTLGVRFRLPMILAPGKYTISLSLHDGPEHTVNCYHWWDNALSFEVSGISGNFYAGICDLRPCIETY